jgi:hypothetical protein
MAHSSAIGRAADGGATSCFIGLPPYGNACDLDDRLVDIPAASARGRQYSGCGRALLPWGGSRTGCANGRAIGRTGALRQRCGLP